MVLLCVSVSFGGRHTRDLSGCSRDRPELSNLGGAPRVQGVHGKQGLTHLNIGWNLSQVLLAADCADAFEVEFQQVTVHLCDGVELLHVCRWEEGG